MCEDAPLPKVTSRLIAGQNVVDRRTRRIGQVLTVEDGSTTCTIRYADNGEVTTTHAVNVRVATWSELRGQRKATDNLPTRVVPKLRTDVPGQE